MALNFELIKLGQQAKKPEEALFNEFKAQMAFYYHTEFREGIRSKLVDKDKNPKWKHKSLQDVSEDEVRYFLDFKVEETMEEVYDMDKFPYWDYCC